MVRCTGPRRPLSAVRNAREMYSGARSGSPSSHAPFVTGAAMPTLIYFLGRAEPQTVLGGAARNVHDGSLHVVGEGQAGNGVGMAGRREHGDARSARYAPVSVRHVDCRLLMPHVYESEALIGHVVHERQSVVARDGEDGLGSGAR